LYTEAPTERLEEVGERNERHIWEDEFTETAAPPITA